MKNFDVYKLQLNKLPASLSEVRQLFNNREFMNSLAMRARAPKWLGKEYQNQINRTEVMMRLLEEELNRE